MINLKEIENFSKELIYFCQMKKNNLSKEEMSNFDESIQNMLYAINLFRGNLESFTKASRKESTGRKRNNNINDTQVIELRKQYKSIRSIATETGLSNVTVQKILRNNNVHKI